VARMLLSTPAGVRPAPHDAERAALLSWLLEKHPLVALQACVQDARGFTPVHATIRSASLATLGALVSGLHRVLGPGGAALMLSTPHLAGLTALDMAVEWQQWSAVHLLACTAPLSHAGVTADTAVAAALEGPSTVKRPGSAAAPPGPSSNYLAGAVGGALNALWDGWGGRSGEREAVQEHQRRRQGGPGAAQCCQVDAAAPASPVRAQVLPGMVAIQTQQQRQIQRLASALGISVAEATALLSQHSWDEHKAMAAGLPARSTAAPATALPAANAGAGAAVTNVRAAGSDGAACLVCFEALPRSSLGTPLPCGHPTCDRCWRGILAAQLDTGQVHRATCPDPGCRMPLPLEAVKALLPPKQFQRFADLTAQAYVVANPHMRW